MVRNAISYPQRDHKGRATGPIQGSCLLWVMSTEIAVDIAVDFAVDTTSIVGRYSVNSRSILGQHSVDSRSIQRSIVGRQSVESRSIVVPDVSRPIQLSVHRHFADNSPIVGRYLTDVLVSNWTTLGRWSVDTWSIIRRQPFDISVESRPIVDRYIGRFFQFPVLFGSLHRVIAPRTATCSPIA